MFEVGFTEILLIFAIALLVLGRELRQEVHFDPLKDTGTPSQTIHTPPAPPAQPAPAAADAAPAAAAPDRNDESKPA
jgi:hypothetical protein